jgi:glycosyltransferase involved in cell wall biosynthesis
MIPVYNCASYLVETLASVLAQDPGAEVMQIQVVDDASTDTDVAALVLALGGHRVEYYRQPANVGSLRNFETCLNRSRGQLVHLLHGDDRVRPGFYAKMGALFDAHPAMGSAACHYAYISDAGGQTYLPRLLAPEAGLLDNWLLRIARVQMLQYVCTVVRRSVYEQLGSFYGTNYAEDWEMWVRIARHYSVGYLPETLAEYRHRTHSISWERTRSQELVPDVLNTIGRIGQHLPVGKRARISRLARKDWACYTLGFAYRALREPGSQPVAVKQVTQAFTLSSHPHVYLRAGRLLLSLVVHSKYAALLQPLYKAVRGTTPAPTTKATERAGALPLPLPLPIKQLCEQ